jgi:hypothetical protein
MRHAACHSCRRLCFVLFCFALICRCLCVFLLLRLFVPFGLAALQFGRLGRLGGGLEGRRNAGRRNPPANHPRTAQAKLRHARAKRINARIEERENSDACQIIMERA